MSQNKIIKPKRRGRKPKNLINNINEKNSKLILENLQKEETIILNLKLNDNNIEENLIPTGFDNNNSFESSPFTIDSSMLENNIEEKNNNMLKKYVKIKM